MAFQARFPGTCVDCGERIREGDTVRWDRGAVVHDTCPDSPDDRDAKRPVCPRCFLLQPCGCDP